MPAATAFHPCIANNTDFCEMRRLAYAALHDVYHVEESELSEKIRLVLGVDPSTLSESETCVLFSKAADKLARRYNARG